MHVGRFVIAITCAGLLGAGAGAQTPPYGLTGRVHHTSFPASTATPLAEMQVRQVFSNLSFDKAVFLTHAGDGSDRLFVVEQGGAIRVFPNADTVSSAKTYLDIRAKVNAGHNETGLLGLAFHPQYASNGKFYVHYNTGELFSRISEYTVSGDPDAAESGSERILLQIPQRAGNHNGGMIAFGPDGFLYIALGDEGGAGDFYRNAQNRATLYGAILRLDVDDTQGQLEYRIPGDNPFARNTNGWREEIWAYGLRNPWRFSFDRETGTLWAADVGQNLWEEIDVIEPGGNYGWNIMEGVHCFNAPSCDRTGLVLPVAGYGHDQGRSITGGYVYRGSRLVSLAGVYLYGDYVSRRIWGLRYADGRVSENTLLAVCPSNISSFGEDAAGEVYIVGHDGRIYVLDAPSGAAPPAGPPRGFALLPVFPNPFNPGTKIVFTLPQALSVRVRVLDNRGRAVVTLLDAVRSAGRHQLRWGGTGAGSVRVSSGVYFVRLQAGKFMRTRKAVLLR